jgi:hypothetical protein
MEQPTESWEVELRKKIIELNDFEQRYTTGEPIKGDIYFDGIEIEAFISSLIETTRKEAYEKGKHNGIEEEAIGCYDHCKQAVEEERARIGKWVSENAFAQYVGMGEDLYVNVTKLQMFLLAQKKKV